MTARARWIHFVAVVPIAFACSFVRDVDDLDRGSSHAGDASVESGTGGSSGGTSGNAGAGGASGAGGSAGTCSGSACVIELATNRESPFGIALDDQFVYWTDQLGARAARIPKQGGSPLESVIFTGSPQGVAVDAQFMYIANAGAFEILHLSLDGTNPGKLTPDTQGYPRQLVLEGDDVFWTNFDSGEVRRANKSDGQTSVLVSTGGRPLGLAVDATNVYWADAQATGTIFYANKTGGAAQIIGSGLKEPHDVAISGGYLYWTEFGGGSIKRWQLGGTPGAIDVLYTGPAGADSIAVDAGAVFWTNATEGKVLELPPGAKDPIELASGQQEPIDLAIDADAVYFTDRAAGKVLKVPR